MGPDAIRLLLYISKCVTAALLVFGLSALASYPDITWCLISAILVLSPDSTEAVPLALVRIKANSLAAIASVLALLLVPTGLPALCLAFAATILLCQLAQVMAGSRPALAAVVIITLHAEGTHFWNIALHRVIAVAIGCGVALLVTYLFHQTVDRSLSGDPTSKNSE